MCLYTFSLHGTLRKQLASVHKRITETIHGSDRGYSQEEGKEQRRPADRQQQRKCFSRERRAPAYLLSSKPSACFRTSNTLCARAFLALQLSIQQPLEANDIIALISPEANWMAREIEREKESVTRTAWMSYSPTAKQRKSMMTFRNSNFDDRSIALRRTYLPGYPRKVDDTT